MWLMPIHPIGQDRKKGTLGSPYAVRDFMTVNPSLGTEADFKRLVEAAHARGMKVLIDIVAGHTAWDSVLMKNKSFASFIKSIGEKVDYMPGADYDKKRQEQITDYKDLIKDVGSK